MKSIAIASFLFGKGLSIRPILCKARPDDFPDPANIKASKFGRSTPVS